MRTFTLDVLAKQWLCQEGFEFSMHLDGLSQLWMRGTTRAFLRPQPIMCGGGWYVQID